METIEQFKAEQERIINILERLEKFIIDGQRFGITLDEILNKKILNEISGIKSEKLKVALIGGFSEGKTSIAAAWSENYNKDTMKIDASESSDEIQIYHLDDFDLIDTPGLFGYKETSSKVKYKEITRRYISEANLILYVMNPSNPIKDSHREELNWLFKELELLNRTIFVISRFDEETDIEDPEEFNSKFKIKKENICSRLNDFEIISEEQKIPIVAVSANPFGEGLDYWLSNLDEYHQISHIKDLQKVTTQKIKDSGGKNSFSIATSRSIIQDTFQRQLPIVQEKVTSVIEEVNKLKTMLNEIQTEQKKSEKNINFARIELRTFISELFTDLILQVKGTDFDTFDEFLEKNIGTDGIVLETTLQNEFERQLDTISDEISKSETSFNTSINHYNNMTRDLAFKGAKIGGEFLKNIRLSNESILAARDLLMPAFKFKPWGAIKLADKLSKGFATLGVGIDLGVEAIDSYQEKKKKDEFNAIKNKIVGNLEEQRKAYIDFINDSTKLINQFFPSYFDLTNNISQIQEEVVKRQNFQNEFESWKNEGEIIEADFKIIS